MIAAPLVFDLCKGAGVGAVAHVLLGLLLGIAREKNADRAKCKKYADRVVVGLGEEPIRQ